MQLGGIQEHYHVHYCLKKNIYIVNLATMSLNQNSDIYQLSEDFEATLFMPICLFNF